MRKKLSLFYLAPSLVIFLISYYLLFIFECGNSIFCFNFETKLFGLFYGMGALSLVFAVLLAAPKAYDAWRKFAVWFVPLAALLFIFYPDPGSGDHLSPYPEQVFQWVSILYILISLTLITRASLTSSPKKS